jgi:hypothetical protein
MEGTERMHSDDDASMKPRHRRTVNMIRILLLITLVLWHITSAYALSGGWEGVEKTLGRKGTVQGDMIKVTFPRSDLKVIVGEVSVEPGLALTSWLGFKGTAANAMVMGDLVLLEREVAQVMAELESKGIEVTALHNHILNASPPVMYLHFSGEGNAGKLAGALRSAIALTQTPLQPPAPSASPAVTADWASVEAILGKQGQKKGTLFQVGFPRKERIMENGMEVPAYLGMSTGINIQMVGDKAATTGDFVLLADEVNPVVKALVSHGIAVTAVHSHMLHETPRLFFLHFWGYDQPVKLARGLKAALDVTNSVK